MMRTGALAAIIRARYPKGTAPWGTNKALAAEFHTSTHTVTNALASAGVSVGKSEHGRSAYNNRGCRCEVCCEAARDYVRDYRAQQKARAS